MIHGTVRACVAAVGAAIVALTAAGPGKAARWSDEDVAALLRVIATSDEEGLRAADYKPAPLRQARTMQAADLDDQADQAALTLAHDLYEGRTPAAQKMDWKIVRGRIDYRVWLDDVLAHHSVKESFARLLPTAPAYAGLKSAFAQCQAVKGECTTLSMNLERWRWLPRNFGKRYLWVNLPAYRLDLIEDGHVVASHKVIVGKPGTRTPVFRAEVTAVTINPWWNVPCSIVDESVGKLVRQRPEEAARRGYVSSVDANGKLTVRQKPGPDNALGRIKLEMPNPYGIYIHDTPSRDLFAKDVRAFSHGCIRTQEPERLARTLLGPQHDSEVETLLLTGANRTLPLAAPLPVYVVYLTAEPDGVGGVQDYPDIYARDRRATAETPAP